MIVEKIENEKENEVPFPKLMESEEYGYVVLFTKPCMGTVMFPKKGHHRPLGQIINNNVSMDWYKDFTGKLISSN